MPNKSENQSEQAGQFVRIFQRGSKWYANYQHCGQQVRKSLETKNKKEALRKALLIDVELRTGLHQTRTEAATIEEAILAYKDYLITEKRAKKTLSKYFLVLGRVAEFALQRGAQSLDHLNLPFIDFYRSKRVKMYREQKNKELSPETLGDETTIIRQLVNFALSRDMIVKDPLRGLKLPKPKPGPQPCYTWEEVQRILAAAPEAEKAALTLLAETGMRFGELAWLTWEDIDLKGNLLHIRPKEGWKPKTGDQRSVPISDAARKVLEQLPQRWRWVVTMPATARHLQPGRQWTERRLLTGLKRILKDLHLVGKLHTFRHYFISNALLKGIPVPTVREWVGQVDEAIIRIYTHIHNSASQTAMQRLTAANSQELQQGERQ